MEYQLLMDQSAVDNILYGLLHLLFMRKTLLIKPYGTVPVLTLSITGHITCLHSFRITTSVILEILDLASVSLTIILQILSGMEQDVDSIILAVNLTILHGSSLLYHREHQMTLN